MAESRLVGIVARYLWVYCTAAYGCGIKLASGWCGPKKQERAQGQNEVTTH